MHIIVSRQALEAIIGRAIMDEEFRLALFADPEAALVRYELTGRRWQRSSGWTLRALMHPQLYWRRGLVRICLLACSEQV